jgi:hypothetical protein
VAANVVAPYTPTVRSLSDQANDFLTWSAGPGISKSQPENAIFSVWVVLLLTLLTPRFKLLLIDRL